jgi:hypothetical protein
MATGGVCTAPCLYTTVLESRGQFLLCLFLPLAQAILSGERRNKEAPFRHWSGFS